MYLENIRDNPLASIQFQLLRGKNSSPYYVRSVYMDYARKAFSDMIHGLQTLESATNTAKLCSIDHVNCASLWFLSIESFISDILEVFYYFNPSQRRTKSRQNIIKTKIDNLIQVADLPTGQYQQTGYINRIKELSAIRNKIFHGEYPNEVPKAKMSGVYNDIMQWNLIDCLYVYKIAMETFHLFDLIIPQLRLMPQIPFGMDGAATWIMLDDLHKEYFTPYFNAVLKKHNLNTNFNATIFEYQFADSTAVPTGNINAIIYAKPSCAFDLSKDDTTLNEQYLQPLKKYLPMSDMIKLPDMRRDK